MVKLFHIKREISFCYNSSVKVNSLESVKKNFVTNLFFSVNVEWSSKNLWERPSKLEIHCKKVMHFSFDFGWYFILSVKNGGLPNWQNLLSVTKVICRHSLIESGIYFILGSLCSLFHTGSHIYAYEHVKTKVVQDHEVMTS